MFVKFKAPRSWVSTPLGVNILLALCKDKGPSVEKYSWINSSLSNNEICIMKNKIFSSSSHKLDDVGEVKAEKVDFKSGEAKNVIMQWVNQYNDFAKIEKYFSSDITHCLINVVEIKGRWNTLSDNNSPIMKIYNSFSYTQDVKYEARILELPLQDSQFKLVLIVPNETDTLKSLVNILTDKGLEEAVKSIQPLFTATCELNAPKIEFESEIQNSINNKKAVQCGGVDINENGVYTKILTCLINSNKDDSFSSSNEVLKDLSSFFFALTFNGTAILTGRYVPS